MIQIEGLSIAAGEFRLHEVSLELAGGEYGVLMGRTGSGKTTLLECICGLRPIERGRIVLAGRDVTHWRPAERGIGYVPQDGALFPQMTVRGHLEFPLVIRRWKTDRIDQRIEELSELLQIGPLLERYPARLSGGELQRVALGRALSFSPPLLLLDEPLSALDDDTRQKMNRVVKSIQSQSEVTVLHVTHNLDDVHQLGAKMFRLRDGRMEGRLATC
jgi:ABC-type sugar transport system ATPase subunit